MTTTKDGNDVLLSNLNLEDIAAALIMLVPGCLMLGHQALTSTLGYAHPDPDEVARKWYGDEKFAMQMHNNAMSIALFPNLDDESDA